MKYILSAGALTVILLVGVLWYTSDNSDRFNRLPGMMFDTSYEEGDLTKLPDDDVPFVQPTQVVELDDGDTFNLTASIVRQKVGNRTIKRLAYNGQIPGPLLKVKKGARVTVHFTNELDMETAMHAHGLRGDYRMDGAAPVTQDPIPVGGTFTYELTFPDTGVFWYHPHVREDYQQELGLYGNMVVTEEGYWNEVDQEEFLIVDDLLEQGEFNRDMVTNTLMGRFGNQLLINDQSDYSLTVKQGQVTRLYLTNVANTRTFDIELPGAQVKLVGGDIGRIEHERMIDDIIIAPAERYVLEVLYGTPGTYSIEHRGQKFGTVVVEQSERDQSASFAVLGSHGDDYETIRESWTTLLDQEPDKHLRLDVTLGGMGNMMGSGGSDDAFREHCKVMPEMHGCEQYADDSEKEHGTDGIEWEDDMAMMNIMSTDKNLEWIIEDEETEKKNDKIEWLFKQGDLVKVRIYNDEKGAHPMQHPIHFHGQRFVVLAADGVSNDNLQWKDTVLIPKGATMDLLVDMSNPGEWMAHCHIAEHLHAGMMFTFSVQK